MKKVTLIGDIMVEPPFMQQVEAGGKYDFKPSFSIFKMVQEEGIPMRIIPVDDLYTRLTGKAQERLAAEVAEIYTRVTGEPSASTIPQKEYEIK